VLHNASARRGEGLWAPLSLPTTLGLLLLATGILLVALALWARPALWEVAVLAGLAVLTLRTERSGVLLLLFAGPLAARALRLRVRLHRPLPTIVAAVLVRVVVYAVARGPHAPGASRRVIAEALVRAAGTPVLADARLAEQFALAGGRIWLGNPLDAFPRRDQQLYLDWLDGRPDGVAAFAHAPRAVLVRRGSAPDRLAAEQGDLHVVAEAAYAALYVRRL
jgi:hypothetical protein